MKKIFLYLLLISSYSVYCQSVVINEVMASNQTIIFDEDGEAPDWIELYNKSSQTFDLSGYYLSDDTANTKKWRFGNAVIKSNDYLLIYASDKNRQSPEFHSNFKISADGERIFLSDTGGVIIDQIDIPNSIIDISYGRINDGALQWIHQKPSPGLSNTGEAIEGYADSISVSHPGGFYPNAIYVNLSAGSSEIYYTLDGSDPDSNSTKYGSQIRITQTTVLKAISYKANHSPGPIIYQTYFINENTDLPVISLSSDPYNLFDHNYGIYADGPGWTWQNPHFGANYWMDWERPGHIEFYDDDKNFGFSKDCILSIYGAWSRAHPQKSFSIKFKDGIDELEYPLFPGFYVDKYKSFILRNSGNDFYNTHIRDAMMQRLVRDLDVDYLEYRPATAFINGEYWGIYNIREKISEHYIANRYGVDPDSIDMLENNMEVIHGDAAHYQQLVDYISTQDMSTDDAYNYVNSMIDLDECLLFFAAQFYYNNRDWPGNNMKYWRERSDTGKWRWILFDLDFGFNLYANSGHAEDHIRFVFQSQPPGYANEPWATLLPRKLVGNPRIKNQLINLIADLLNTNFKSERVIDIINEMADHIFGEIQRHRDRFNINGENLDRMISFAQERPGYLRNHVRNYFKCGNDGTLKINANTGGKVNLNSLQLKSGDFPWTGVYFQNNTIHLKAIPEPGYKFDGWSGAVATSDESISLNVVSSTNLTAHFSIDSSSVNNIVINEINYNSSNSFDSGDWIELLNTTDQAVDISNWYFSDSDTLHKLIFPTGTLIGPKQYLVLVENDSAFTSRFPEVKNYLSEIRFGLGSGGEFIKLANSEGEIIDSLTYDDKSPWPEEPDGDGATLELFNPVLNNSAGENWRASLGNGTPGKINSVYTSIKEDKKILLPENFILYQNYPNPFNPSTTISFSIPKASFVTLKIYNTIGQLITQIVSKEMNTGAYTFNWFAGNIAAGIYYCRMTAGNYSDTIKLMLLK